MKKTLIVAAVLFAGLNLSGCVLATAGAGYHGDHGDLVSKDGTVRYIGWCEVHPQNSHCREPADNATRSGAPTAADRG